MSLPRNVICPRSLSRQSSSVTTRSCWYLSIPCRRRLSCSMNSPNKPENMYLESRPRGGVNQLFGDVISGTAVWYRRLPLAKAGVSVAGRWCGVGHPGRRDHTGPQTGVLGPLHDARQVRTWVTVALLSLRTAHIQSHVRN